MTSKSASIDDLIEEFKIKEFTLSDFNREKAYLEAEFIEKRGIDPDDIDEKIRSGQLSCMDPLVEAWVDLQDMSPYVEDS